MECRPDPLISFLLFGQKLSFLFFIFFLLNLLPPFQYTLPSLSHGFMVTLKGMAEFEGVGPHGFKQSKSGIPFSLLSIGHTASFLLFGTVNRHSPLLDAARMVIFDLHSVLSAQLLRFALFQQIHFLTPIQFHSFKLTLNALQFVPCLLIVRRGDDDPGVVASVISVVVSEVTASYLESYPL